MSKLLRRPKEQKEIYPPAKFEKFNLIENPFPSEPVVNKDSMDKRVNGDIYEFEIRKKEYDQIVTSFLKEPQSNPSHLRLGYIIDTSYIGRGNGKSAFLVNLQQDVNKEFCLDISAGINKCFSVYVTPEPGGRTKTFPSFVDVMFEAIISSNMIKSCLAILRLEALTQIYPETEIETSKTNEANLIETLSMKDWYYERNYDIGRVMDYIFSNEYLQDLPPDFPLFKGRNSLLGGFAVQEDFRAYFANLKKGKPRLDFVFSYLIRLFQAAGFNGAFILVDDFERIPDFQSARQKRDFALELRSCLFDGLYINARIGFYDFLLVLHAGVQRLIEDAWAQSGLENRAPISPRTTSKHVIPFEKLTRDHASLLLKKYLSEYRINLGAANNLSPFTEGAVGKIGELSEYNAARILKMAYDLLDKAAEIPSQMVIDERFVTDHRGIQEELSDKSALAIEDADPIDLQKKARE